MYRLSIQSHAERATAFAREFGLVPESAAYLDAVEAWRAAWKPRDEDVRVVLLAESHVAEQFPLGDTQTVVKLPASHREALAGSWPKDLPERYVRLVYCLGYGEPELCSGPLSSAHNQGTWQYWDLLGAVTHGSMNAVQPRRSTNPGPAGFRSRLSWKVQTLEQLRRRGVWLMDTSPVALYALGGRRIASGATYRDIIRQAFLRFIVPHLTRFMNLEQVWVIGRDMGTALVGRPTAPWIRDDRIISQPQDRNTLRYRADVARMVSAIVAESS